MLVTATFIFSGCEPAEDMPSPGGGGGNTSEYTGVWVRLPGPSGDRTDLAIGNIPGEPSTRVYMCEKKGSLTPGFFKGHISGSTITFDAQYGLPTYTVSIDGGELLLKGNISSSIATPYTKGSWGGDCGPLQGPGTTGGNDFVGVWVRLPGPSGDRSDLAIGNIPGEPASRVYMCEKKGSLTPGFFKGNISGSTITFDSQYGLPTYTVSMYGDELLLKGNISTSIATPYKKGSWGGDCGPLQGGGTGSGTGEVMFWTRSDLGCGNITVTISGQSKTMTSYFTSGAPSCGTSGAATFELPEGTYSYSASCNNYHWGPSNVTVTENGCFRMELK